MEEEWIPKPKPPLGELIILPKPKRPLGKQINMEEKDRMRSEALLAFDYWSINDVPELSSAYTMSAVELNKYRNSLSLPPKDFQTSSVRLIDPQDFKSPQFQVLNKSGGFYEPRLNLIFSEFDPQKYDTSRYTIMCEVYKIIHEETHQAMEKGGIGHFFNLNEGITEMITQEIMNDTVLRSFLNDEEQVDRQNFVDRIRMDEGFALSVEDVIYSGYDDTLVFSRVPQIRVAKRVLSLMPDDETRKDFVRKTFLAEGEEVESMLLDLFGPEITKLLAIKHQPQLEVFNRLGNI